jgi:hypothetical protein
VIFFSDCPHMLHRTSVAVLSSFLPLLLHLSATDPQIIFMQ